MPFNPTFVPDPGVFCVDNGKFYPYNDTYYATPETAHEMARRYGAVPVEREVAMRGPFVPSPPKQWFLRFPALDPGHYEVEMNAGFLADYFRRNPEADFPGLADKYVKMVIQMDRESARKEE